MLGITFSAAIWDQPERGRNKREGPVRKVLGKPLGCPLGRFRERRARRTHDWKERQWRHLDTCEFETWITARVPRIKLEGGKIITCESALGPTAWALYREAGKTDHRQLTSQQEHQLGRKAVGPLS
ncbi:MAG: transposase family protein [Verrucomicrobiota bacterium]